MFYQTPLDLLKSMLQQIDREIEWYAHPNRKGTNWTDAHRAEQVAKLETLKAEYETVNEALKEQLPMEEVVIKISTQKPVDAKILDRIADCFLAHTADEERWLKENGYLSDDNALEANRLENMIKVIVSTEDLNEERD